MTTTRHLPPTEADIYAAKFGAARGHLESLLDAMAEPSHHFRDAFVQIARERAVRFLEQETNK